MSVQFEAKTDLPIPHIGLIWEKYRNDFPHCEQHAPLNSLIERPQPTTVQQQPVVSVSQNPATPRVWFLSPDKDEP